MHTVENEFDRCVASIEGQSFRDFEHRVISGKPNREAHEACYGGFMDRRDDFDLLIKVDADMVIRSPDLFAKIAAWFETDPQMQILTIGVMDYFTGRLVSGLNTYRNTIRWAPTGDMVFTDQFPMSRKTLVSDNRRLAPAADHCPDPSPFQAFHFGLHRGVKAAVSAQRGMHGSLYRRCQDLGLTWHRFRVNRDRRLGLAALGGELALAGRFGEQDLSYTNPKAADAFERYSSLDSDAIASEVRALRGTGTGRWPWRWRMETLRGPAWSLPVRLTTPQPIRLGIGHACRMAMGVLQPGAATLDQAGRRKTQD